MRHPICDKPFTWVDLETTGLDPSLNDIIEIAIVQVAPDGREKGIHAFVKIERPQNAHPKALEVNGYSEERWADAIEPAEAWRRIASSGLLQECILAGQNVTFDAQFLNATFKRHGLDHRRVDYHLYDTVTLALEHLKPWLQSVSLVPVCVALGIPIEGAHSAMADCRMAMAVNRVLTKATSEERARWATEIPIRLAAWAQSSPPD